MNKNNRPEVENPLAGMGLDDIVRGITNTSAPVPKAEEAEEEVLEEEKAEVASKPTRQRRNSNKVFEEYLTKYKGLNEQGVAVWLPKEVKKRLEFIRVSADRNIPLRSLAAAIIMTYINENEERLNNL